MRFDIELIIKELNQMVRDEIVDSYAVGGAVAANIYVESATTEDVDVFVIFKPGSGVIIDPTPVLSYFKEKGYLEKDDRIMIGGWPVQFLPPPGSLEEEAMQNAVTWRMRAGRLLGSSLRNTLLLSRSRRAEQKIFQGFYNFWKAPHSTAVNSKR